MDQPFQSHSETSREAAARKRDAQQDRIQVAALLKKRWDRGATDLEIQEHLEMEGSTQRPRRIELCDPPRKLVVDSGRKRPTPSNRNATVWMWWEAREGPRPESLALTAEEIRIIRRRVPASTTIRKTKAELVQLLRRIHRTAKLGQANPDKAVRLLGLIARDTQDFQ